MEGEHKIELPMVARSLCKEAVEIANGLIREMGESYDPKADVAFLADIISHVKGQAAAVGEENLAKPDFDPFNFFTIPADLSIMEEYFRKIGLADNPELLAALEDDEIPGASQSQIALLLYQSVRVLKSLEDRVLTSGDDLDYPQVMGTYDAQIHSLASLLSLAKTITPGTEFVIGKARKRKGGQISAEKRKERYSELKDMVLEEVEKHYSHLKGAKAARAVFEKLGPHNKWLIDEKSGKPISEDPVALFTRWITNARSR